jgi:hypothetical protein
MRRRLSKLDHLVPPKASRVLSGYLEAQQGNESAHAGFLSYQGMRAGQPGSAGAIPTI